MAEESSNNDGEREDSGLQDILSVAAKIKDSSDDSLSDDDDMDAGDSGMILFTAGDSEDSSASNDDDELFGSFSGGLGAGFGAPAEPLDGAAADLTPLSPASSVKEARPAEVTAKPAEESKRSPLVPIAVVLGLALVGGAVVMLTQKEGAQDQQARAETPAPTEAAVGAAEEPQPEPPPEPADAGNVEQPEPDPELAGETEGETEGLLEGETEGVQCDPNDPMCTSEGLLENDGSNGVAKAGKWDRGKTYHKKPAGDGEAPDPEPEPDPDPLPEPKPKPSGGGDEAEVECLLNPDLPHCQGGGGGATKEREKLAPKVPDKLSKSQLRAGINTVKSNAKKCGPKHGVPPDTTVHVHISIEGATGKVTSVKAKGEHAGTALGTCVEDALSKAQFEIFKNPAMGIDYPIIM